jgi:hypothetical protein
MQPTAYSKARRIAIIRKSVAVIGSAYYAVKLQTAGCDAESGNED